MYRSSCPLDCYSSCGLLVDTENGRVTAIKGDPGHPLTKGKICIKAKKLLDRLYSPDRILYPLARRNGVWKRISWDDALDLWAGKLTSIKERYGSTAVLHHDASGSNGILRGLGSRFFNIYGGVTEPQGSLCWGSGYAAQLLDFGALQMHEWEDLLNSSTILLWGRDPARTNPHLLGHLRRAAAGGAEIISINPVRVRAGIPGLRHISPRPGTDGALALAMASVIISEDLVDHAFVAEHVHGYQEFASSVREFKPERAAAICGISGAEIESLARRYAMHGPSAILFGYGMQRYANSGRTVRCIDALAAITGNIGIPGGGANYVQRHWKQFFADLSGKEYAQARRLFPWPALARHILEARDPPVRSIVVTRSNPVNQLPNTNLARQAFQAAGFVVVIDFFMTDTAAGADLVLPCTTFLEDEDIVISSWNNYANYTPAVIEPLGECRSELSIFTGLARRLGLLSIFGDLQPEQWLRRALAPAAELGITIDTLRRGPVRNPLAPKVAWENRVFATPSGKYELYSSRAIEMGLEPLPVYRQPASDGEDREKYPYCLITPHHRDFTHSQFWNLESGESLARLPEVEMHPEAGAMMGLNEGESVWVESPGGRLQGIVKFNSDISPGVISVFQGRWISRGGGVNVLTPDIVSDLGDGSCYYDCRCRVVKN
ncbi:molybdopterin-containing oxidoreductase family protein [Desulfotruncus alcoholivorax]|uniref:molybdopterin-containing oxidoreductase family protein n=1 Tax=Desulfotruncus alcoholivorax TaxID=265477 RepID=UPI001EE54615|nr:molybdopterin-dependent oxidoreductase [Desulfotruncus alcoholivorax]